MSVAEINHELLITAKEFINNNDISSLQTYWTEIQYTEFPCPSSHIDWCGLFQKLYLHSCLKGHKDIASWFEKVIFLQLDPIQQIALRQVFPYGRYLLAKKQSD